MIPSVWALSASLDWGILVSSARPFAEATLEPIMKSMILNLFKILNLAVNGRSTRTQSFHSMHLLGGGFVVCERNDSF